MLETESLVQVGQVVDLPGMEAVGPFRYQDVNDGPVTLTVFRPEGRPAHRAFYAAFEATAVEVTQFTTFTAVYVTHEDGTNTVIHLPKVDL